MAVGFSNTNKPINPRGLDASPKGYNRAALYSGKALDFDGVNDYVDLGQNLGFINTGDFTFLANAKFDVLSGDEPIMGQGSGSTGNAALVLVNALGKLRFAFYGDDLDWDEPIQTGKWYSLAFTFNRTTKARSIYVNGQLAVSDVTTLTPNATGNTFVIGKVPYLTVYADAQITGVKAFNTALTAAQVADLYNNPEKIVPTGVEDTALKLWLPMMEGAGTTAYDGSGNGNHGTISGATYVNGVGAPVAQSAVIDWNKGVNLLPESNGFVEADLNYAYTNSSETEATITAPDGSTDAFEYICDAVTTSNQFFRINPNTTYTSGQVYTYSLFVKYNTKQFVKLAYMNYTNSEYFAAAFDLVNGLVTDTNSQGSPTNTSSFIEEAPNGWYRIGISAGLTSSAGNAMNFEFNVIPSGTPTWSTYGRVDQTTTTSDKVYIYGASLIEGEQGPYIHTIGTAQTSPVLLPQGLTSGRDITGVNLFENVRKQGALNLDGNSWAEVHDNASLDFGTGEFTLEAWAKVKYKDSGSSVNAIMTLGNEVNSSNSAALASATGNTVQFWYSSSSSSSALTEGDWVHIVGVYDETNATLYVNGSQVDQDARTAVSKTNDLVKYIGRDSLATNRIYNDQIAQPRIYNRALTAEEVERNYNAGKNIYK